MRCASRVIAERALLLGLVLSVTACGQLWPRDGLARCEEYSSTVQPVLTARCVSCHGEARADGDYRLDGRANALARRDDGTSRVAGEGSALRRLLSGELEGHPATTLDAEERGMVQAWVTACKAGPGPFLWHVRGWGTPGDEAFHGSFLRSSGYQALNPATDEKERCGRCHGDDLSGGKAGVSCKTCHGPEVLACKTCHGSATSAAPPKSLSGARITTALGVGAHRSHVADGPLHLAYGCERCHTKVDDVWQDGHFQRGGAAEDGVAEVTMTRDGGTPVWERGAATCTNTACHAPVVDSAATNQAPVWTKVGQDQAACGTCHGSPPATHSAETNCGLCHGAAFQGGVVPARHADGVLQVGRGLPDGGVAAALTCASCHFDGSGAVFDTQGRTDEALKTVGAHRVHLAGARNLVNRIGCADCHLVPTAVRSPGHIDSVAPAEVFPAVAGVAARARADNATPAYDGAQGTCANAYCHGGGTRASADSSPSKIAVWPWTGPGALTCGACHGAPPNTAIHQTVTSISQCTTCHGATISASGNLKVTQLPDGGISTTHLNGQVETGS